MQSLSLVMSECFLSGRGQSHVSNFYIVDLKNFATASRRWRNFLSPEFGAKFQREVPLFLKVPKFPYNTV